MAAGRLSVASLVGVAVAMIVAAPATAEIRDIGLEGGTLTIKAGDARDVIGVAVTRQEVRITDRDPIAPPDSPCKGAGPDAKTVSCPRRDVDEVAADLGDGDDAFDADGALRFEVEGDTGDDEIDGGDLRDLLEGKYGDDRIDGSDGGDQILGGLDDDVLIGKGGRDLLDGGPGTDRGDGGAGKDECVGIEKATKEGCR